MPLSSLPTDVLDRLVAFERNVAYKKPPAPGTPPFVVVPRASPVILSAPHGAVTFRDNGKEIWHPEDEFTAGMALLLGELCAASAIATTRLTETSDPNEHPESRSEYKQALRRLATQTGARWVLDLHGAGADYPGLAPTQLIDLGTGATGKYLPEAAYATFVRILESHLGVGAADRQGRAGFPAQFRQRIAAFAHLELGLHAVQIEMKPSLRVPLRWHDSLTTLRPRSETFIPDPQKVCAMLRALTEFIEYLRECS